MSTKIHQTLKTILTHLLIFGLFFAANFMLFLGWLVLFLWFVIEGDYLVHHPRPKIMDTAAVACILSSIYLIFTTLK